MMGINNERKSGKCELIPCLRGHHHLLLAKTCSELLQATVANATCCAVTEQAWESLCHTAGIVVISSILWFGIVLIDRASERDY